MYYIYFEFCLIVKKNEFGIKYCAANALSESKKTFPSYIDGNY